MASAEEDTLVRKLLSTIITALTNGDELSPARLSRTLRDAVCARGLYIDTNFDILHVIDQLARFRSGVKSSDQLRVFFTEKHQPNLENLTNNKKDNPCEIADAIVSLSKQQADAKMAAKSQPNTPESPPQSPVDTPALSIARSPSGTPVQSPSPESPGAPAQSPSPESPGTPVQSPSPESPGAPVQSPSPESPGTPAQSPSPESPGAPAQSPSPESPGTPAQSPSPESPGTPVQSPSPESPGAPAQSPSPESTGAPAQSPPGDIRNYQLHSSIPGPCTPPISPPRTPSCSPPAPCSPKHFSGESDTPKDDKKVESRVMLSFPVSIKNASTLIGFKGKTVKAIEKTTGAKVDVINELNERVVVIRGDLTSCEAALSETKLVLTNTPNYSKGVLYEADWQFIVHKESIDELNKIAAECQCVVMELTKYRYRNRYLFIYGDFVAECVTRINKLETEYLWLNKLELKTITLNHCQDLMQYTREELLLHKTKCSHSMPRPLSSEAAELVCI